jgi:hypothetical protein
MDSLYELIKSLSKNEKRYFKIYAEKNSSEEEPLLYLDLFNKIEKLQDFNEKKLKEQLKGNKLLNNFKYNKHYLHRLILKSLALYHSEISANVQIKQSINYAEILYWKGLYKQALKILISAKKKAYQHEKYFLLMEILDWESRIVFSSMDMEKTKLQITNDIQEEMEILKKCIVETEFKFLRTQLHLLIKTKYTPRGKEDLNQYESFKNNPLLDDKKMPESFRSRYDYFVIKGVLHAITGENIPAIEKQKQLVEWIEKNSLQITENPVKYTAALHNYLISLLRMKRYDEFIICLNKLKNVQTETKHIKANIFSTAYVYELMLYVQTGDYKSGLIIVNEVEKGLDLYKEQLNLENYLLFWFLLFVVHFLAGDYSKALFWINKIINDRDEEVRQDIKSVSVIANLILHREMHHFELLEYLIKSAHRDLDKKKRLYKVESTVINFVRSNMTGELSKKQALEGFKKLKQELLPFYNDPYEKTFFEYFDLIAWLDSKIEDKPFAEVLKERN